MTSCFKSLNSFFLLKSLFPKQKSIQAPQKHGIRNSIVSLLVLIRLITWPMSYFLIYLFFTWLCHAPRRSVPFSPSWYHFIDVHVVINRNSYLYFKTFIYMSLKVIKIFGGFYMTIFHNSNKYRYTVSYQCYPSRTVCEDHYAYATYM